MADKYQLKVTAGNDYASTAQHPVLVNTETPIHTSSPTLDATIKIRVKDYRGLPKGTPTTCAYFATDQHKSDRYSLEFSFVPKQDINSHDLVLGSDFDHPLRDRLPPGTDLALKILTWFIDPGLYGDVRADKPHLFGPLLSSVNTFRIDGPQELETETERSSGDGVQVVEEGTNGNKDAEKLRTEAGLPSTAAKRRKHFLKAENLKAFTFKKGVRYTTDFFNPYLDFNDAAIKLPGFGPLPGITIPVMKFWDGQPLRYVVKNRATDEVMFVIVFNLVPRDVVDEASNESQLASAKGQENHPQPVEHDANVQTAQDDVD